MVKHQKVFVVLETTSNVKELVKSGAAPLYRSLVTSLINIGAASLWLVRLGKSYSTTYNLVACNI